jgi:hypothetical protein
MSNLLTLTAAQLRIAADTKEKIANLEKELAAILGASAPADKTPAVKLAKKKHTMSAEGRARVAAAQKARWAKIKAAKENKHPEKQVS